MFRRASLRRLVTRAASESAASPPRVFPTTGFRNVAIDEDMEEETLIWYHPHMWYPVRIGEIFQSRYQVLTKLGYGGSATAWLCRDLQHHKYAAVKVPTSLSSSSKREEAAFARLASVTGEAPSYIRRCFDTFSIDGRAGFVGDEHHCFVLEALSYNIKKSQNILSSGADQLSHFRTVTRGVMEALKFLHTKAKLIVCDLRQENFLLRADGDQVFRQLEEMEMQHPSARKIDGSRIIIETREFPLLPKGPVCPVLSDYGEMRPGDSGELLLDVIQPFAYRAPEVVLRMPWSYPVDVWNAGVMLWHHWENEGLFNVWDVRDNESTVHHLADMISIMGMPPRDFLQRTVEPDEVFKSWFDRSGKWIGSVEVPDISLESRETRLKDDEKAQFLRFMRRMLKWVPEERATAAELCEDPWLADDPSIIQK